MTQNCVFAFFCPQMTQIGTDILLIFWTKLAESTGFYFETILSILQILSKIFVNVCSSADEIGVAKKFF